MAHHVGDGPRGRAVTPGVPRLVLDTHVWLDLLVFDDPRVAVLDAALREGRVEALVDQRMRDELVRVLGYRALALDPSRQAGVADRVDALSARVEPTPPLHPVPRCHDPDDQMFVEVAVACSATALLSRDDALLRLAGRLRAFGVDVSTPAAWCATRGG